MNREITAIIKKDMKEITADRQLFITILIVPLVLTLVLPSVFLMTFYFLPEESADLQAMINLMPDTALNMEMEELMITLLLNHILPMFFLIIPIMASSVMASSSFVGERVQSTLETLLYCPLSLKQIFCAKVLASFLMSMLVAGISFSAMAIVLGTEIYLLTGSVILPGISWIFVMFIMAPAISLTAITLIVRSSARAQNVMEAQQRAVFLILPLIFLLAGQFSGLLLVSPQMLAVFSLVLVLAAWVLLKTSMGKFCSQMLLKR